MACLNINSLLAHIDELESSWLIKKKSDILEINETKLDLSIHDDEVHLHGYEIVWKYRNVNGRMAVVFAFIYEVIFIFKLVKT